VSLGVDRGHGPAGGVEERGGVIRQRVDRGG
jgi:hypothetical protein